MQPQNAVSQKQKKRGGGGRKEEKGKRKKEKDGRLFCVKPEGRDRQRNAQTCKLQTHTFTPTHTHTHKTNGLACAVVEEIPVLVVTLCKRNVVPATENTKMALQGVGQEHKPGTKTEAEEERKKERKKAINLIAATRTIPARQGRKPLSPSQGKNNKRKQKTRTETAYSS